MSEQATLTNNQLVIYYDKVVPEGGPRVQIDEFVLISNAPGGALEAAAKATEIAHKLGDMVPKPPDVEAVPATVKVADIVARIALDAAAAGTIKSYKSEVPTDFNPFKETKIETLDTGSKEIKITTTTTDYPFFTKTTEQTVEVTDKANAPVTVEKSPDPPPAPDAGTTGGDTPGADTPTSSPDGGTPGAADGGTPADAPVDAGKNPKVIAPLDEPWVSQALVNPFLAIMAQFGTMTFSTSAGAEAYLDYELNKAGIELSFSSTGLSLADAGPQDPAGIESQLRARGIGDQAVIDSVRDEANAVILQFEDAIEALQFTLSNLDVESPDYSAEFVQVVEQGNDDFSAALSANVLGGTTSSQPAELAVAGGVVTMSTPPESTETALRISPNGLIVRAGVGMANGEAPPADAPPGFYATPVISVFDQAAWQIEA